MHRNILLRCYSSDASLTGKLVHSAIARVAIVGAGQMGSGIAQVAAVTGHHVILMDKDPDVLAQSKQIMATSLGKMASKKYPDDPERAKKLVGRVSKMVKTTTDIQEGVIQADLVIEAVVEDMEIKKKLFIDLNKFAPCTSIFATNTSTFLIKTLADVIPERRDRIAGLHFFNPVPVMKLLEIVIPDGLSREVQMTLNDFGKALGKQVINCKDTPGFVVNRLLIPFLYNALFMYERGDASMEDIDKAMKLGGAYPMGPFQLMDYIGLDTMESGMKGWVRDYPEEKTFRISKLLGEMIAEGKLGLKSGEGFRKY